MLMGIIQERGEINDMGNKIAGAMTLSKVRGYGIHRHMEWLSLERSMDISSLWNRRDARIGQYRYWEVAKFGGGIL